jgi:ribosomal protein S18 acetylase RimI-like enzyme
VLARADRNMATAWEALLSATPRPRCVRGDGYLTVTSGLPVPLFNPTFVLAPPADPAALIDELRRQHQDPFIVYSRDAVAPGVGEAGIAAGLIEHFRPPLMVLDEIPADADPLPPGLVIERVDTSNIDACGAVLAAGFHMPVELAPAVFGPGLLAVDEYITLLGTVDGEPVSTAAVFVAEGLAGIYSVATHPDHGGKGYGGALTTAAARAGRALGPTTAILQSSAEGQAVYERLGYRVGDRYRQLEGSAT